MKSVFLALAALVVAAGLTSDQTKNAKKDFVIVIGGDSHGYLSPCGCSEPMVGGIRRRATVIRQLSEAGNSLVLENGGFTQQLGRQSEMKAEALAEVMGDLGAVVNFSANDAQLGLGTLTSIARLSNNGLVSGAIEQPEESVRESSVNGPFLVTGATAFEAAMAAKLGRKVKSPDEVAANLVTQSKESDFQPILMLDGERAEAEELAQKHPGIRLIVYSSLGDPLSQPARVGNTLLVTPGESGKYVLKLNWDGQNLAGYHVYKLGPDVPNDPKAARVFKTYLNRVEESGLLDLVPRQPSGKFVGSKACKSCHEEAYKVWSKSGHSHALKTLEKVGQSKDPDCVPCHVVALRSENGFRSRIETPDLAMVGCESCHGAGADHVADPKKNLLSKSGKEVCLTCHTPQNSPNFDFAEYWPKILHK